MASKLKAITIARFKSIYERTRVDLGGLTVFVGKNNSGKSTITQALLLLKQTLELARVEVPLHLDGYVTASNLRELISGWPEGHDDKIDGPELEIEWVTQVNPSLALHSAGGNDLAAMQERTRLSWLDKIVKPGFEIHTRMQLRYSEVRNKVSLETVKLQASPDASFNAKYVAEYLVVRADDGTYECLWDGQVRKKMDVDLHHFVPTVSIDRRNVGPRDAQRALTSAFNLLFAQPLDELEKLLRGFSYLSSTRSIPPAFYPPVSSSASEIGVSGEFAAQLLYAHKADPVHYLLPNFQDPNEPLQYRERPLAEAVNEVLAGLGIDTPLSIHEIERVGFRLLFGKATLSHVGRGLTYLLPIVQLGLFSDPKRFQALNEALPDWDVQPVRLCAFEEPESHLHPRVQSRLATWFLSLAKASRQVIVETHSDHLVRRLRSILAASKSGSEFEIWLMNTIRVVSVDQVDGKTRIESSRIRNDGAMEVWPPDFMDAATKGEEQIYFSSLDKVPVPIDGADQPLITHEAADEPDGSS